MENIVFTTGLQLRDYISTISSSIAATKNLVEVVTTIERQLDINLSLTKLYTIKSVYHDPLPQIRLYVEHEIVDQAKLSTKVLWEYSNLVNKEE